MADRLSSISEAIKQAGEAYAETISALSKAVQDAAGQTASNDRGAMIESWLRVARIGKDGVISAIEQGFEMWERELRRMAGGEAGAAPANPMEAWVENWRSATAAFTGAAGGEEFRKQAEAVQKTLTDSVQKWQEIWQPAKKQA